ncbi:hypothetical protein AB0L13_23675 [Saccharopolyspora shandongensis]|uniref:hypothetical protein n=1 Tax=Saccharopolyspora shandongensis TaxID=418495 RepID=UPI00342872B7
MIPSRPTAAPGIGRPMDQVADAGSLHPSARRTLGPDRNRRGQRAIRTRVSTGGLA